MSKYIPTPEELEQIKKENKSNKLWIYPVITGVITLCVWWALREVYDIDLINLIF